MTPRLRSGQATPWLRRPYALLTKQFLRQFLENDLISPDADRTQLLAVVGSLAVSLTLFISMFMSAKFIGAYLTPGQAAVLSLNDKFFYLAMAMVATALMAAVQWDALTIDARDAAILEPLPVSAATVRRAKLTAVAVLGGAVAVGLNVFPSLIFPWLLAINFPQMKVVALLGLMLTHAVMTLAAAAFGYFVVIAVRETLTAVLGRRGFAFVSPWAQGILIVVLGSALLLLPPSARRIAQRGFDDWRAASPPMWFLGAYESVAGGVIVGLPRSSMTPRQATHDLEMTLLYERRRAGVPALARRAAVAFGFTFLLAWTAYLWNARRLPALTAPPSAGRRWWRGGERVANTLIVREGTARAGFYFTLAAMWRNKTHRVTLAGAAAAGFAMVLLALSNADVERGAPPSIRLLVMQPLLYGALLVGFRHIIRVPAELRANWGFQLAWRERDRAFLTGVRRAAIVALVLPALAVLLPLYVFVLGTQTALLHAAFGLAGAIVFLELLLVSYEKVPFTCTYLPSENMKALVPIYFLAFLIGAVNFARMQVDAIVTGDPTRILITLAVLFVVLRVMSLRRVRRPLVEFDEAPSSFQRLGLHT
ncbi:MAG TPA: hypothetical protein VJ691_05815 [Vicinamibacterales bacterium]|nr:hypothetical protein [Vicinamibacterales bacterium]